MLLSSRYATQAEANGVTYSSSERRTLFSHGSLIENEGRTKPLQQDFPQNFYDFRVNEEVGLLVPRLIWIRQGG